MSRLSIRLQYLWRRHGLRGLVPLLIHNIVYHARRLKNHSLRKNKATDPFDRQYGIETSGLLPTRSLDVAQLPNAVYAGPYEPSPVAQVSALIEKLDIDATRFTFIDFGSGKGRVLFVAAQYPFREVIGVEFSRPLHEIALGNIARFPEDQRRCGSIRSVLSDAGAFILPASDLVCYFYNPFGPEVLGSTLQKLVVHIESGYRVIVIYVNPVHRVVFDQNRLFTVIAESPSMVILTAQPSVRNMSQSKGSGHLSTPL